MNIKFLKQRGVVSIAIMPLVCFYFNILMAIR